MDFVSEHGEEDVGLTRGREMYLSRERLAGLQRLFLRQQVENAVHHSGRQHDNPADLGFAALRGGAMMGPMMVNPATGQLVTINIRMA